MKLVLLEAEHEQLRAELARWEGVISSALLQVEAIRACARYGPAYASAARDGLTGVALLPLDERVLESATELQPATMRALDALHLATALSVVDDLGVVLVYDERLHRAVREAGLSALRPGRES